MINPHKNMKLLAAVILASLASHGPASLAGDLELPLAQSLTNIDAIDKSESVNLMTKGGSSAAGKLRALRTRYPQYRMLSGCIGSFSTDGAYDIAVGLINPRTKTAVYAVGMSGTKGDSIMEIAKFPIGFDDRGIISKPLEILCESRTELLRVAKAYEAPRPETPAAGAQIKPISYFDAVCVAPSALPEDFICYGYSVPAKSFVKIGSWFND